MGGLDWSALPYVADMLGVRDSDALILQLVAIRKYTTEQRD